MTKALTSVVDARETGPEGAPLIALVHGAMDRGAGMARIGRRLDTAHRVIRYDRRGYGRSAPHPGPFSLAANTDDLLALVGERPVVVIGHSLGGHIALRAASLRPDLVRGVVVYESPLSWEPWWPGHTGGDAFAAQEPAVAAESFVRRMAGDGAWEKLPAGTREARRAEGVAFMGEIIDLRRGSPFEPDAVVAPVVVGVGSRTSAHHLDGARLLAARLPDAHVVTLEGCRHGAHTAASGLFVEQLVVPLLARLGWPDAQRRGSETSTS